MNKYKKAYVEITNVCNKNCSFCHGTKREKRYMTEEEFERVLSQLSGITDYIYLHVLGEPLCHPQVMDFIRKARDFKVTVTTNGVKLSDMGDELLESGVYKVQVSLHSFDGIGRLEDYITPILDFADKASEKGILVNLRLWNKGKDNTEIEREINTRFPKHIAEKEGNITLKKGVFLDIAEEFGWPDLSLPDLADPVFCYGMRDQFAVLSNGIVTPCCLDAEGDIPLGNIFKEDLRSILNTTKAKNIYDGFTRATAGESLCRKCPYAHEKFSSKAHHLSKNIYK